MQEPKNTDAKDVSIQEQIKLFNSMKKPKYPLIYIARTSEANFCIQIAVAGISKSCIRCYTKQQNTTKELIVSYTNISAKSVNNKYYEMIYNNISQKDFDISFPLTLNARVEYINYGNDGIIDISIDLSNNDCNMITEHQIK